MAMTNAEFTAAVNTQLDRIIDVKNTLQLNALLFSNEYTPENFAKKMNLPGNSTQGIDRRKTGLNSYEYFCNTLTGGYIHCVVTDAPTTTGGNSMTNPIEEYFAQHKTQLRLFKYGVVALVPVVAVVATEFVSATDWTVKATLIAAITGLNLYVAKLDPEKYWGGVGAGKKK